MKTLEIVRELEELLGGYGVTSSDVTRSSNETFVNEIQFQNESRILVLDSMMQVGLEQGYNWAGLHMESLISPLDYSSVAGWDTCRPSGLDLTLATLQFCRMCSQWFGLGGFKPYSKFIVWANIWSDPREIYSRLDKWKNAEDLQSKILLLKEDSDLEVIDGPGFSFSYDSVCPCFRCRRR